MKIGHIHLARQSDERRERFAALVAALAAEDIEQHVLVASVALARQLANLPGVTVGPVVKTPVMAYCLMPDVDLAHVHEVRSGQAGLLLTLTRTIPYVITAENEELASKNPLTRSVFHRTAQLVPCTPGEPVARVAVDYIRIYRDVLGHWFRGALML